MGSLRTLGTILYYFGLMIMMGGFLLLAMGLGDMLTQVTGQIKDSASGSSTPDCPNPPCFSDKSPGSDLGPFNIVLNMVEPMIDSYFSKAGFLAEGDSYQQYYYPKFRRFFAFLAIGLAVLFLGVILKMFSELEEYLYNRKKKVKTLEAQSMLYREKEGARIKIRD